VSSGRSSIAASAIFVTLVSLIASAPTHAETAAAQATKAGKPSMIQTSDAAKPASYNANSLHRLDFRVVGKSCAVCLMKIQRQVKILPGAVKVAVMLRKPYGGVVVYDSSKISKDKLMQTILAQDKDVRIEQIVDTSINKVPTVLIPLYGIPKRTTTTAAAEGQ
jgi:copper chaperone CopZ